MIIGLQHRQFDHDHDNSRPHHHNQCHHRQLQELLTPLSSIMVVITSKVCNRRMQPAPHLLNSTGTYLHNVAMCWTVSAQGGEGNLSISLIVLPPLLSPHKQALKQGLVAVVDNLKQTISLMKSQLPAFPVPGLLPPHSKLRPHRLSSLSSRAKASIPPAGCLRYFTELLKVL